MKTRTIVIARSSEDSESLVRAVEEAGFRALVEPVLSIEYPDVAWPEIEEGRTLVFTSANGVRAFARKTESRRYPVLTVGQNTAEEARRLGFEKVESADGTVQDLANLFTNTPERTLILPLYLRGEEISQDLGQILREKGQNIEEFIVYKANPAQNLSINLLRALDERVVEAIMFFSSRGGRVFGELIEQYSRLPRLRTVKALCISEAVAESLSAVPFQQRLVSNKPDRYGMMELLNNLSVSED